MTVLLLIIGMAVAAAGCIVTGILLDRRADRRSRWTKW